MLMFVTICEILWNCKFWFSKLELRVWEFAFLMDSQGQRYNEGYEIWETVQWYKLKSNTKHSNLLFKATYSVKATLQMSSPLCVACHHTRFIWSDSQLISESKVKPTLKEVQWNEWWLAPVLVHPSKTPAASRASLRPCGLQNFLTALSLVT